jgi:hypothetical protein
VNKLPIQMSVLRRTSVRDASSNRGPIYSDFSLIDGK